MRHILFVCVLVAAACGPSVRNNQGDDGDDVDASNQPTGDGTEKRCEKMDVLFVIDNSGSMGQEQTNLIANFPGFMTVLNNSGLDYRVAVTTTGRNYTYNMTTPLGSIPQSQNGGDNGAMLKPGACNMTKRWIDKSDTDPSATFSCVANVGVGGPSDEMPLSAMRDAFEERMADGTNMGFRRTDALLAVVFLTDEEDCSYEQSASLGFGQSLCDSMMEPVQNYVSFLDTYTGHRSRWATAAIAGPGPGSCSSTFGDAAEASRLKQFVSMTGPNGVMASICDGDLSIGLGKALMLFQSACGDILL
ncbi:MAG: hypothetical protein H0T65_23760 [Deltaproteobacteria bacterium]|nr:hypothetical protein [Deltaproteobacteria bacterium]